MAPVAIVTGTASGVVGLGFFGLQVFFKWLVKKRLEKASESRYQKEVIAPIAEKIFKRVRIGGCLGYTNTTIMEDYLRAIGKIIAKLGTLGFKFDKLGQIKKSLKTDLINEIAKQTELFVVGDLACCSKTR